MSPEEFDADLVLQEVREKKRALEESKRIERLWRSGMSLGAAIGAVTGIRPIDDQIQSELDDYMRDHYYKTKGETNE